jgi:hypothetical protein
MATENLTLSEFFGNNRNPFNYAKIEQVDRDITTQWLSLDEITQQLNLFNDESQDSYLSSLELATRMAIEDYLGLAIFPISYRVYYGNPGPGDSALFFDLPEVGQGATGVSVSKVEYYGNTSTAISVLPNTSYFYDPTGNRVVVTSMPSPLSQTIANPVVITYTQSVSELPQYPVIKQAGLLLLTHLYNNRSNTTERIMHELPYGVSQLLRPYKPLVM